MGVESHACEQSGEEKGKAKKSKSKVQMCRVSNQYVKGFMNLHLGEILQLARHL